MRQPWPRKIRHVALCGWPEGGKNTVARMLEDEFCGQIIDDGWILRKAVPFLFGVPEDEPFTHEGKAKTYSVLGREESVRQMLGELGNYLEGRYGEDFMPVRAMQIAEQLHPEANFYIYPSVRKTQGRAYRRLGGIVIEISNPLVGDSGNAFDRWDPSFVDLRIINDPLTMNLDELREYVCALPELLAV